MISNVQCVPSKHAPMSPVGLLCCWRELPVVGQQGLMKVETLCGANYADGDDDLSSSGVQTSDDDVIAIGKHCSSYRVNQITCRLGRTGFKASTLASLPPAHMGIFFERQIK